MCSCYDCDVPTDPVACPGGKVSVLSGSKGAFDAVAIVHPAMLSVDDVKELSVPLAMYPSKVGVRD